MGTEKTKGRRTKTVTDKKEKHILCLDCGEMNWTLQRRMRPKNAIKLSEATQSQIEGNKNR